MMRNYTNIRNNHKWQWHAPTLHTDKHPYLWLQGTGFPVYYTNLDSARHVTDSPKREAVVATTPLPCPCCAWQEKVSVAGFRGRVSHAQIMFRLAVGKK